MKKIWHLLNRDMLVPVSFIQLVVVQLLIQLSGTAAYKPDQFSGHPLFFMYTARALVLTFFGK